MESTSPPSPHHEHVAGEGMPLFFKVDERVKKVGQRQEARK